LDFFASLAGFNLTELDSHGDEDDSRLEDLLNQYKGLIPTDLNTMAAATTALEGLLTLPSFSKSEATSILNMVDKLVDITGQVDVKEHSLKLVTNK
jgi:hypothetical protein